MQRAPEDHVLDKVLPETFDVVHAVVPKRGLVSLPKEPHFLENWSYVTAMCGATVKVLLPQEFDPGDPDACQHCVGPVSRDEISPVRRGRHEIDPEDV